jgi:hypothetical protein
VNDSLRRGIPTIRVPSGLESRISGQSKRFAECTGCTIEEAQRAIEITILTRGLRALEEGPM